MAEMLETGQMLANTYEPKRKFRWVLQVDGIDAFVCKTASRPQQTFEETVVDFINTNRYLAGKMAYATMSISLNDPIAPSAAQKVMEWVRDCYEVLTGRMGYATMYKRDFALKLLDPQGAVVEHWDIRGAWLQDSNFGDLDYSSSDIAEIQLGVRYDVAVLQY